MSTHHTVAELIAALSQSPPGDDEPGFTSSDLADQFGVSETTIRKRLKRLFKEGRLKAHHAMRAGMDGRPRQHTCYTLTSGADDISTAPGSRTKKRSSS